MSEAKRIRELLSEKSVCITHWNLEYHIPEDRESVSLLPDGSVWSDGSGDHDSTRKFINYIKENLDDQGCRLRSGEDYKVAPTPENFWTTNWDVVPVDACDKCGEAPHERAGCMNSYCDCTEKTWAVGKNEVTYCSKECAERYGNDE